MVTTWGTLDQFRVEITRAVNSGKNDLEIDIVNLWPNRLIGDAGLPRDKWFATTNVRKFTEDYKLFSSGLLGPVVLQSSEKPGSSLRRLLSTHKLALA